MKDKQSVSICSKDADRLCDLLAPNPNICIQQSVNCASKLDTKGVEILLADPNLAAKVIHQCNNLRWMQSTWAGNAPLVSCDKRDYILTVAKGIFDVQIREYVFTYLLSHVRKSFAMNCLTSSEQWQQVIPNYLSGKTLGILGTGSLAKALLPAANVFGLKVIGLSRSGKPLSGFDSVYTLAESEYLATQSDFVVNLLPDTQATRACLNQRFFSAMKPHSLLINAGRGTAIDEDALLHALDNNQLSGAVLDVFNQEPLADNHPFWPHPKIMITHHTAAISQVKDIVVLFNENVQRYRTGKDLLYQLDWEQGY